MEELIIDDGFSTIQCSLETECPLMYATGTRTFERMSGGRLRVNMNSECDVLKAIHYLIVNGRAFSYAFNGMLHTMVGR